MPPVERKTFALNVDGYLMIPRSERDGRRVGNRRPILVPSGHGKEDRACYVDPVNLEMEGIPRIGFVGDPQSEFVEAALEGNVVCEPLRRPCSADIGDAISSNFNVNVVLSVALALVALAQVMISDAFATEVVIFCFGQDHLLGSSTTAPFYWAELIEKGYELILLDCCKAGDGAMIRILDYVIESCGRTVM